MSDMGDDFKALREESQIKRASNRNNASEILKKAGVSFLIKNGGAHFVVFCLAESQKPQFDFWPGTGKFINRNTKRSGRGIFNLIREAEKK